jgi:hypothetical protein
MYSGPNTRGIASIKARDSAFLGSVVRPTLRDNMHSLVGCESNQDLLRMYFNEDEVLNVWVPSGLVLEESTFQIRDAERVRWEWFAYGRPKIPANRFFKDFVKNGNSVVASTNVDWYTPDLRTDPSLPAVEILRIEINKPLTSLPGPG